MDTANIFKCIYGFKEAINLLFIVAPLNVDNFNSRCLKIWKQMKYNLKEFKRITGRVYEAPDDLKYFNIFILDLHYSSQQVESNRQPKP